MLVVGWAKSGERGKHMKCVCTTENGQQRTRERAAKGGVGKATIRWWRGRKGEPACIWIALCFKLHQSLELLPPQYLYNPRLNLYSRKFVCLDKMPSLVDDLWNDLVASRVAAVMVVAVCR